MKSLLKTLMVFLKLLFFLAPIDVLATEEFNNKSIFQMDHKWTSQQKKSYALKDLGGTPIVTTMTFASCPGACPLMISDIKSFDKLLNKKEKNKIKYITFSIDPARDTPEALKKFHQKMHLDNRWLLLTSNSDQVREMAAVLGFSYKDVGDGDFTHSTSLYLLSADGVLLARKERSSDWKEFLDKFRNEIASKK